MTAQDTPEAAALAGQLKEQLWNGRLDGVIATLKAHAERRGPPRESDGPDHLRRVLTNTLEYFETHRNPMDYPLYRRKGWPMGWGVTESAVKLFNKRVKGTKQFWSAPDVESILLLRALRLSQDNRWNRCRATRPAYEKAAYCVSDPGDARMRICCSMKE